MGVACIGSVTSRSQIVSATLAFSKPAIITISPASPTSMGTFFVPSYLKILVNLPSSTFSPLRFIALIGWLAFAVPWDIFPTKLLPKKLSAYNKVDNIAKGFVLSSSAGFTCSIIKSNSGWRFSLGPSTSLLAHPDLPLAYKTGKSNCSSFASKLTNKSNVSSKTSSALWSALSNLLIITIGLNPCLRAFAKTNFVWGITPSAESISNNAPSAILNTRSTSAAKSLWPGVSIILILESFQLIEAGLAKIVIPLSFSSSPESINLSSTTSFSLNEPLCFIRVSIMVVLPWSTCAIIVMFRILFFIIWGSYTSIESFENLKKPIISLLKLF